MPKLNSVATSQEKANAGVWIPWEGMEFKIARLGNDLAKKLISQEAANNRERKERGEEERPWEEFWVEMMAKAILLDWRKVERDDGSAWPYTQEDGLRVLKDPRFIDLKDTITRAASQRHNFLEKADETAERD